MTMALPTQRDPQAQMAFSRFAKSLQEIILFVSRAKVEFERATILLDKKAEDDRRQQDPAKKEVPSYLAKDYVIHMEGMMKTLPLMRKQLAEGFSHLDDMTKAHIHPRTFSRMIFGRKTGIDVLASETEAAEDQAKIAFQVCEHILHSPQHIQIVIDEAGKLLRFLEDILIEAKSTASKLRIPLQEMKRARA